MDVNENMQYGYVTYALMKPELMGDRDALEKEMDIHKEAAEKHGFHMKYWGHPYGVAENIIVVFKSEKGLGEFQKMNQATNRPYTGDRTILATRP